MVRQTCPADGVVLELHCVWLIFCDGDAVASSLLGEDFNYGSGDGHYYVGDTAWHPDEGNTIWGYEPGPEAFAIKVAFYLDPVRADSGALRVIPKSHLNGGPYRSEDGTLDPDFMAAIGDADSPLGKGSSKNGNIALECDPGDLVVFNHKVLHSAWGGGTKRRMFTMVTVLVYSLAPVVAPASDQSPCMSTTCATVYLQP
jgi:hypothetical protein